jgi:hypothetical protein
LIDFYVDFEFRSIVLQKIIGALFGEASSAWSAPSSIAPNTSIAKRASPAGSEGR